MKKNRVIIVVLILFLILLGFNLFFNNNNKTYKVKKNKKLIEISDISIIKYDNIKQECNSYDCVTYKDFEKQIKYLKDNNYKFITINDFENWRSKKKKLYNNNILLLTTDKNIIKDKKYNKNINYVDNNSGLTLLNDNNKYNINDNGNSVHNYNIRVNTSFNNFKEMVSLKYVKEEFVIDKADLKVPVLNYHFFYSPGTSVCNEKICENTDTFRQQLDYLVKNNYTILTMDQYVKWIYGEIDVPENSVLITIDDGGYGTGKHNSNLLIPILEEYKIHATLFLITGWWDMNNYRSPYLEIQSHTYDMHNAGKCGQPQVLCATKEEFSADVDKSIEVIGDKKSFCYPFYKYDDKAIEVLKEKGFKIAFAGTNTVSTRESNKYAVPRFEIFDSTSFEKFTNIVK